MSDQATNQQTLAAYNQGIEKYIAGVRAEIEGSLAAWFDTALHDLPRDAKILEIGSANGRDANHIESHGYQVERTDGSQAFVDYLTAAGQQARVLNILTDPIPDGYDLILANAVFLHFTLEEFRSAVKKVHAALVVGGRFALTLKRGSGDETTTIKMDAPRYFRYWQPQDVVTELESIGFQDVTWTAGDDWREGKPQWLFIAAQKGQAA